MVAARRARTSAWTAATVVGLGLLVACGGGGGSEPRPGPGAGIGLADHEIVFTRQEGADGADLWLARADGSDPVRLTDDPGVELMAAWSPDGDQVAYAAGESPDGPFDLFVLDVPSGTARQVTRTPDRCESAPTWTPDGEDLVYASRDCVTQTDGIFTIPVGGGQERRLVAAGSWPDVGPDGRLLYSAPVSGDPWWVQRVVVSEPDGSDPVDVTPQRFESASEATWSPDGGRIAFVAAAGDPGAEEVESWNEELYVMDADGGNPRRVTTAPGNDHWPPSWSPDGHHLVFSADGVPASGEVATVDLETLVVTALSDNDVHDLLPAWRP